MLPKLVNFLYALKSYWYIKTQEQRCQRVDNGFSMPWQQWKMTNS